MNTQTEPQLDWDRFKEPIKASVNQLGEWHCIEAFLPITMPDGRPEAMFLAVAARVVDGELKEFTTDFTQWNDHLETRHRESQA